MFKFLERRRLKRNAELYRAGWDFAAGRLLEAGDFIAEAIEYLENGVDTSRTFGEYSRFDEGVEDAMKMHRERS